MDVEEVLLLQCRLASDTEAEASSMKQVAGQHTPVSVFQSSGLVGMTSQFLIEVGFLRNLPSVGCCPDPILGVQISQTDIFHP